MLRHGSDRRNALPERDSGALNGDRVITHRVYADEAHLLHDYATCEDVCGGGASLIVLSTASRRKRLEQTLRARASTSTASRPKDDISAVDVADALSSVMVDDWPDDERFSSDDHLLLEAARDRRQSRPSWRRGENARRRCWLEGNRKRRFALNSCGTRWPDNIRSNAGTVTPPAIFPDEDNRILQQIRQLHSVIR